MVIKSLKLKNYRNYELLDMTFDSKTNILYGDNAQGKTNILEALYLSGTTKSHRGTKDRDLIQFGREESHLETIVEKKGMEFQIDMHLKKNSPKGIAINKIPIRKASELFGIVHFVFFSPEDLNIIKDGPAGRRRFIDLELSQIDKVYLSNLSNYNRIINQRNSLLKELYHQDHLMDTLDIWDMQLAEYGTKVIESPLSHGVQVGGEIYGSREDTLVFLTFGFTIKLLPPFAYVVQFGIVVYSSLLCT